MVPSPATLSALGVGMLQLPMLLSMCCHLIAAVDNDATTVPVSIQVGEIGGWVMLADGSTLVASKPSSAELLYFDTVKCKQQRAVELDFAPNRLAIQNDTLYASVRGSSIVYALNALDGAVSARFKLPGEPVEAVACHHQRGPLFAAKADEKVFSIEPASGTIHETAARHDARPSIPLTAAFC
jgi:hypothetical protein